MAGGSERHRPEDESGLDRLQQRLVRSGFIEYDRVIFFSDAVFAIAITLLAVNLRVPVKDFLAGKALDAAYADIIGFWISFAVIAFFWLGHHGTFRFIVALDRRLISLNLLFLGAIAFLPYPTDLLSRSNGQSTAVIFYAACGSLAGLAEAAIWLYATHSGTGLAAESAGSIRNFYLARILRIPAVFLISIPVAVFNGRAATIMWSLIWVSGIVLNRFGPRRGVVPEQTD